MIDRHLQSKSTLSGDPVNLPVLQLPWRSKRSMSSGMMRMLRPATCTLQMITVLGCPEWTSTMQCTTLAKLLHNCPDIKCLAMESPGCRKLASLLRKMPRSSPGLGSGENQGSSSDVHEDPDTDSNEEDDPINLNLNHSALDDDHLGDEPHSQ